MKRIPRPKGLTKLTKEYSLYKKETDYKKIINILAINYINNEYMVDQQPMNTYQLAEYYQVPFQTLIGAINKHIQEMSTYLNPEDLIGSHRSILSRILMGTERDRALIVRQLQRLLAAQGEGYRPYISAEVNNALKLLLASSKNLIDLSDRIIPKNPEVLNIMFNQNKTESLSVQDAISLIRQGFQHPLPEAQNIIPASISPEHQTPNVGSTQKQLNEAQTQFISNLTEVFQDNELDAMPNVKANKADLGASINTKAKKLIEDPHSLLNLQSEIPEPESLSDYEDL